MGFDQSDVCVDQLLEEMGGIKLRWWCLNVRVNSRRRIRDMLREQELWPRDYSLSFQLQSAYGRILRKSQTTVEK